jgi:hypothetical protein
MALVLLMTKEANLFCGVKREETDLFLEMMREEDHFCGA